MAQRRMFSPSIVESDAFLEMPVSSQALYFHLGMYADDDGFINPKRIMRMIMAAEDDLKMLMVKRFVIAFENGIVVIKHWKMNNMVRKDWYRPTQYIEQKAKLFLKENGAYTMDSSQGKALVNEPLTEVRLGKVSIGKYITAPASQDAEDLGDGYSVEPDEENTPTGILGRSEGIRNLGYDPADVNKLVKWAELKMGHEFTTKIKQKSAIKKMLSTKHSIEEIQKEWDRLSVDSYWSSKGLDFSIVSNEIGKFKNEIINKSPGVTKIR